MADRRRRQPRKRLDDSETVEGDDVEYSSGEESDTILDAAADEDGVEESDYTSAEEDNLATAPERDDDSVKDQTIPQTGRRNEGSDDRPSDLDNTEPDTGAISRDGDQAAELISITERDSSVSLRVTSTDESTETPAGGNISNDDDEETGPIVQRDVRTRDNDDEVKDDTKERNVEEYSEEEEDERSDGQDEMEDETRDKEDAKSDVPEEERGSGDGQEEPDKKLDDDEDRKNPQFVPRRGPFYMHDSRYDDEDSKPEKKPKEKKKLWQDEDRWRHDKFIEEDQAPKSVHEIRNMYGFDIRQGDGSDIPLPRRRGGGGRGNRRGRGRGRGRGFRRREDDDEEEERNYSRPGRPPVTQRQQPPSILDVEEQEWPSLEQQKNQHVPKRNVRLQNHDAWAEEVEQQEQESYRIHKRRDDYRQNEYRDYDNDDYNRDVGNIPRGRGRATRARGYRRGRYSQQQNIEDRHVDERNDYEQQWGYKARSDSQRSERHRGRFDDDSYQSYDSYTDRQNQRNQRYRENTPRTEFTEFNRDDYERTGKRSPDDRSYRERNVGYDERRGYGMETRRDSGDHRQRQRDGSGEHKTEWVNRSYRKPEVNSNERTRQTRQDESESWGEGRGDEPRQSVAEHEEEDTREETVPRKQRETKAYSRDRRQRTVRQGSKEVEVDTNQSQEAADQEVEGLRNLVRELKMDMVRQDAEDDGRSYPGHDIQSKIELRPAIEPVGTEVPVQGPEDGQRQERYDKRERGRPKRYSSQRQRSGHEETGPSPRDQLQRGYDRGHGGYQQAQSPDFPASVPTRTPPPQQPMTTPPHAPPASNTPPHVHQTPLRGDPRARPAGPEAPQQMVHPPPPPPDVMVQHDVAMHAGLRPPGPSHLPSAAFFTPNHPPPQLPPPPPPGQLPPPQFMGAPVMFVGHHYPVVRPQVPLQSYSVPPPNVPAPHQHPQGPHPPPPQPPQPSQPPPPQEAAHPPTSHSQPMGPGHPGSQIVGGITYYSPELQQSMKRPPPARRQANPLPIEAPPEERRN